MTRMSELDGIAGRRRTANRSQSQGSRALARGVHDWLPTVQSLVIMSTFATGCVIPPNISVTDTDAAVNSPPAILSVRTDLGELTQPGPVTLEVGATAGNMTVDAVDTDLADQLFVRVFVDYDHPDPEPARATCIGVTSDAPEKRTATCDLRGLCKSTDVDTTANMPTNLGLFMTVVVFDREPLDTGDPAFQAMPPGGLSTNRAYFLRCKNPAS